MAGFNLEKYAPSDKKMDFKKTVQNIKIFIEAYQNARMRVSLKREPNISMNWNEIKVDNGGRITNSVEDVVIYNDEALREYEELHKLYLDGMCKIYSLSPNPEITERLRKVFYDRFVLGLSVYQTAQRNLVSEQTVIKDSPKAVKQFAIALDILVETKE